MLLDIIERLLKQGLHSAHQIKNVVLVENNRLGIQLKNGIINSDKLIIFDHNHILLKSKISVIYKIHECIDY